MVSSKASPELVKVYWERGAAPLVKCRCLLSIIFLYALLGGNATAQVKFVQLTDPHLFDKTEEEMSKNKEVLVDAVRKINELNKNNNYAFVVVTGDIGVEQIVKTVTEAERSSKIDESAKTMANILASSEVKVWLFVPGNNDLVDEMPDTIKYYHQFIAKLRDVLWPYKISVTDLCPEIPPKDFPYTVKNEYAIIGFNNASFKNNNDSSRLRKGVEDCCNQRLKCSPPGKIRCEQQAEIRRVSELLNKDKVKFAYIFYHIPEVDDPYLLKEEADPPTDWKLHDFHRSRLATLDLTGDYRNSSWFVGKDLRTEWNEITKQDNVKGLFAGHLHDNHPDIYTKYPEENSSKLYICPPLAIKLQAEEKVQARGFREVSIDEGKDPNSRKGKISRATIYWYDHATWLFSDTPRPIASPSPSPSPDPLLNGESMTWQERAHFSTVLQFFLAVLQFLVVVISVYLIWQQLKKQGEQLEQHEEQLKQQTGLARVANTQALVALASPFHLEMAKNREMAELWAIGPKEWDALDEGKKQQYESMLIWWFIFYENIFFQAERGLLDEAIFDAWKKDLDAFVEEQFVEKHWSSLNKKYHREFVDYLNSRIEAKNAKGDGSPS